MPSAEPKYVAPAFQKNNLLLPSSADIWDTSVLKRVSPLNRAVPFTSKRYTGELQLIPIPVVVIERLFTLPLAVLFSAGVKEAAESVELFIQKSIEFVFTFAVGVCLDVIKCL